MRQPTKNDEFHVPGWLYWVMGPLLRAQMWLEARNGVFRPLESRLLHEIASAADGDLARLLSTQLMEINHATRTTAKTTEVVYFRIVGVRPTQSRSCLLPVLDGEQQLARVAFRSGDDGSTVVAKLCAVDRRVFSLEFDRDVRSLLAHGDIEVLQVEIVAR